MRPVFSHSSAGASTGISISCPPIPSISSLITCTIFSCVFQPAGRKLHSPALTWRIIPARTSSLCEIASASAGSSRRVGRNSSDWRLTMSSTG